MLINYKNCSIIILIKNKKHNSIVVILFIEVCSILSFFVNFIFADIIFVLKAQNKNCDEKHKFVLKSRYYERS